MSEVQERKNWLINQLKILGISHTIDGRRIDDVSLYTLEWTYTEEMNKAAEAYGS